MLSNAPVSAVGHSCVECSAATGEDVDVVHDGDCSLRDCRGKQILRRFAPQDDA
jgi:hypothetical protein